jgi:hypothetical protein
MSIPGLTDVYEFSDWAKKHGIKKGQSVTIAGETGGLITVTIIDLETKRKWTMSKRAEVTVDPGYRVRVEADDWVVTGGLLTLRLNGEPVAEFNRWVCVKWATEEKPECTPLVDILAEGMKQAEGNRWHGVRTADDGPAA